MKFKITKTFLIGLILIVTTLVIVLAACVVVSGNEGHKDEVTFIPMTATAYCINGTTASGSHTRKGIAASKPEWIGLTAMVYKNDNGEPGEFLGYYEIKDTGGKNIRSGKVIDLWFPTYDECIQFGRKKVLVVLVKGVG